jgi:hypothetical protein
MSLQSELKLPWPETTFHFPAPVLTIPTPKLSDLWKQFIPAFQGKYSRFANYLMYLSTDFSGGFKVCSVLSTNPTENTFQVPYTPPGPPLSIEIRNQIWTLSRKKQWEELDREEWEMLGFSFLLTGDLRDFNQWVEMTKTEFGLSDNCQKFLTLLGWYTEKVPRDNSILQALVDYSHGDFVNADFNLIANAVLKEGYWQLSGVLFDALAKGAWSGKQILPFLDFLTGFYSEWQDWEKSKFLKTSLGKVPPFSALKRARKLLNKNDFLEYSKYLISIFRGDWEEPEAEFGYESTIPFDPFMTVLIRYDKEGDSYFREIKEALVASPYSYFVNLQMAILAYRNRDYDKFLEFYEKGGRLRYLPLPLYLYAKVKDLRKEETLADSILKTLERHHKTPIFPSELGEV